MHFSTDSVINYNQSTKPITYFRVRIAEKNIEIVCQYRQVFYTCKDYLTQFQTPDFTIKISQSEIDSECKKTVIQNNELHVDNVAIHPGLDGIEAIMVYEKIAEKMIDFNTVLIHGAAIDVENHCFIFLAPSGTGKTTHVHNWVKVIPNTRVINGDKPLINLDKMMVYGTPWCGKEKENINTSTPLTSLIWIERGEVNAIRQISFAEMLPFLIQQCYIPKENRAALKAYQLLGRFSRVSCFRLTCNANVDSAYIAYETLIKRVNEQS